MYMLVHYQWSLKTVYLVHLEQKEWYVITVPYHLSLHCFCAERLAYL